MTESDLPIRMAITVRYTNHRGETALRRIVPLSLRFAASEWYPEEQWLLDAHDLDKDALRSFALKDMRFSPPAGTEPFTGLHEILPEIAQAEIARLQGIVRRQAEGLLAAANERDRLRDELDIERYGPTHRR